jgi:hypothetical protein
MSKIDRALIIRRLKVDLSMEYAQICAESCERHGVPYEFIDGIEFMSSDDAFKAVGTWKRPEYIGMPGHNNCHASHIKSWRRIVEIGKPCLILEHDAIVKGDVRNIDIPDMAVITFGHRVGLPQMYEPLGPIKSLVRIPRAMGVHACGLSPATAQWLISDVEKNGVGNNVDEWLIMKTDSGLPLYVTEPPQVICWPRVSTREWTDENKRRQEMGATWTFADACTPGWTAGFNVI